MFVEQIAESHQLTHSSAGEKSDRHIVLRKRRLGTENQQPEDTNAVLTDCGNKAVKEEGNREQPAHQKNVVEDEVTPSNDASISSVADIETEAGRSEEQNAVVEDGAKRHNEIKAPVALSTEISASQRLSVSASQRLSVSAYVSS